MTTLCEQTLCIDFRNDHLWLKAETLAAGNKGTILVDEGIAGKHHILGGLAKAAGTIDITSDASSTLLTDERKQILVLANQFVGCAEVEDNLSPLQRQFATWRNGCPEVFANLDGETSLLGVEEQIGTKRNGLCTEVNLTGVSSRRWNKPSLFIELLVVG